MASAPSSDPDSEAADVPVGRANLVLAALLRLMRPLVRLLLRHGVQHRAFAVALKQVFLEAAQDELRSRGMAVTDSAITLLSGVHRRDVRSLLRSDAESSAHEMASASPSLRGPASLAAEVVGRWLSDRRYRGRNGRLRVLPRGAAPAGFDALVESISRDVRPRALLDELLRLGVVQETDAGVQLVAEHFTPKAGFAEVATLFSDNLHDHAAAASENLHGGRSFLDQAVFVDEISPDSARALHRVSVQAWKDAFQLVMAQARERFEHDAAQLPPEQRRERARFGVYFYSTPMDPRP